MINNTLMRSSYENVCTVVCREPSLEQVEVLFQTHVVVLAWQDNVESESYRLT